MGLKISTKIIAHAAVWAALVIVTYVLRLPLPFLFPSFLQINASEIILFLSGFILGPAWACILILLRLIMTLPFSTTAYIGELADFIYSLALILPAVMIYRKKRNVSGLIVAFSVSVVFHLIVTSLMNALWITDAYLLLYGLTPTQFLDIVRITNPQVVDPYWSLVLWVYLPFNVLKNSVMILFTLLSYKRLKRFLKPLL
jgi:riboflavin transporter FmnP